MDRLDIFAADSSEVRQAPRYTLRLNNQNLQVFKFEDSSSAESLEMEHSSDVMSIGQTAVQLISPPHFFQPKEFLNCI